eukprot:6321008-Prymnesium_polylepis.2
MSTPSQFAHVRSERGRGGLSPGPSFGSSGVRCDDCVRHSPQQLVAMSRRRSAGEGLAGTAAIYASLCWEAIYYCWEAIYYVNTAELVLV